jgi:hypothetical protein
MFNNMSPATLAAVLKEIRSYSATEWELFIEEWLHALKHRYFEVKRLGGTGDLGRDVVAFTDTNKLEGIWDNYQCKHLERPLPAAIAGLEIARLIFFTFDKRFRAPRKMYFVAPRGVSMDLSDLLNSPAKRKLYITAHWNKGYAPYIVDNKSIPLDGELSAYVSTFDFSIFSYCQTSEVVNDHRTTAHWSERFGGLLPPPPTALVPPTIQDNESAYLEQLLPVYSEKIGSQFEKCTDLAMHSDLNDDLNRQRERFFQAEAFNRHYRDETEPGTVERFVEDIFDAIDPVAKLSYPMGYDRLNSCLSQAAHVHAGGILAPHARPKTKQGVCHQLANELRVNWIPK